MQDQYEDIGAILAKYPDISLEEDISLKNWINQSEKNRRIFEELSSPGFLDGKFNRFEQIEAGKRSRWLRVLDSINTTTREELTAFKHVVWFRKWQTYVAAAILIMIFISGAFWFTKRKHADLAKTEEKPVPPQDVKPGQFKAKLTLADGSTIILDSAKSGTLVQQDGTNVINKDGKLVYEKGGQTNKVLYNTLSTAKAQTYATVLSDGSKVWLNSESSIRYPVAFTGDVRKVEITGEAYFEVAHSSRPFIVSAAGMDVEVLGTHFNINSYAEEPTMKTTLLEGKVRIHSANHTEAILKPGEQAIVRHGKDDKISVTKDVDVDAEVAWRFGYFNFDNVDLKTMMRQLERWYDVEVEYQGEVPDGEFFGKIPRELTLSQVLNGLQNQDVHFKVVGKKIIVTH
jgi:ferric-dicitrate binding protein FerR (iron transport regulator)